MLSHATELQLRRRLIIIAPSSCTWDPPNATKTMVVRRLSTRYQPEMDLSASVLVLKMAVRSSLRAVFGLAAERHGAVCVGSVGRDSNSPNM